MCCCPADCEGGPECLDGEGGPLPDRRPFAVCAPGMRPLAELALLLRGEHVSEVRESAVLEGTAVYVLTPPDFSDIVPQFVLTPPPPPMSAFLRDRALAMAITPLPTPLVLDSVI